MNALTPIPLVTTPGVYDLSADAYHADPCPTPSLSAGMINDLLTAPAKCFANSRRLNPGWEEPDGQDRFTIGTVSHIMFLEPGLFEEKVVVCDHPDWRGNAARVARDAARDAGRTPILSKHMNIVLAARAAFLAHDFTAPAFANGKFEQSLFWKHPVYGFWCRVRPDFIADSLSHVNDYKATTNANPDQFGRHAYNLGYHRRAAWYLDGVKAVFGREPNHYWFVNQEIKAPYLTAVVELDTDALDAGRSENARAADLFARSLETARWPGYRHRDDPDHDRAFRVGLPTYAYSQIQGEF